MSGYETGGGGHVDSGFEDAHEMVHIGPLRVVDDTVRFQSEQGLDVCGCRHADRVDPDEFADVASDLVGPPRVAADNFEVRIGDRRPNRTLPDIPGRPLHDAVDTPADHVIHHLLPLGPAPRPSRVPG
jgi:hypothetical protein